MNDRGTYDGVPTRLKVADVLVNYGKDVSFTRNGLIKSPFREERTPSFHILAGGYGWVDFGDGTKGGVIDLVMRLEHCDRYFAIKRIIEIKNGGRFFDFLSFIEGRRPTHGILPGCDICVMNSVANLKRSLDFILGHRRIDLFLDNGYGDKQQDTFCNRVDIAADLSYHITLCSRLELYARAMVDAGLIGEHTTDHESGEKASSTFNKMDTKMGILATPGLRWYFCNKAGLWVEGGHDAGYVSAGLSFKF